MNARQDVSGPVSLWLLQYTPDDHYIREAILPPRKLLFTYTSTTSHFLFARIFLTMQLWSEMYATYLSLTKQPVHKLMGVRKTSDRSGPNADRKGDRSAFFPNEDAG